MADFCVDNTQQVEFDEKVVCGLWQCEALRASQKGTPDIWQPISSIDLCPIKYHNLFQGESEMFVMNTFKITVLKQNRVTTALNLMTTLLYLEPCSMRPWRQVRDGRRKQAWIQCRLFDPRPQEFLLLRQIPCHDRPTTTDAIPLHMS